MSLFRKRSYGSDGIDRWIVVGLGNPGAKYADTRHNAGARVLEVLLGRLGGSLKSHKSGCLIAEGSLAANRVVLARPTSYMNLSGRPVRQLKDFYKAPFERVLVVHDELDVPFGDIRVKVGGGTAGHNGLKSLSDHLGTKDFPRIRIGIGRPAGRDAASWVLERFSGSERKDLPDILERAADAVESFIEQGPDRTMNAFNTRT
ncbi:MAG: aminoacyl-tRNA hydrolase [Actinomycetota bacterium]